MNYAGAIDAADPLLSSHMDKPKTYGFSHLRFISISPDAVSVDQFSQFQQQVVLEFWLGCNRVEGLPASAELDPFKFSRALGFIQVLQPNEAGNDLFYRLYGTHLVGAVGGDFTGLWVSEIPLGIRALMHAQYIAACRLRRPIYSENDTKDEFSTTTRLCRLILPMAGADGVIDRVLVASAPCLRPDADPG